MTCHLQLISDGVYLGVIQQEQDIGDGGPRHTYKDSIYSVSQ